MSTEDDVRRLATALPNVAERTSYGTPAFYVAGRIFARMHEEPEVLICWRESVDEREALLADEPNTFFTTDHYKHHASILVRLDQIEDEELFEVLTEAWEARAPKRLKDAFDKYPFAYK